MHDGDISHWKFRGLMAKDHWSCEAVDLSIIGLVFAILCLSTLGLTSEFFGDLLIPLV